MIAPVEEVALNIFKKQADELNWKVRQALEKVKPPTLDDHKGRNVGHQNSTK